MNAPHANHPTPADLAAFAVGKLSDAEASAVAVHLESCPDCRRVAASASGDSFFARVREARPSHSPRSGTRLPPAGAPAPAPPPNLPSELARHPRYRILRELGRGGMGVVYQARQIVMNRQVVIKVINKALLDHPDALERFRREVQAAAKLSHPNIVTAYDAEQAGELHMLVMEFVPGQNLAEVLQRKGPLPVAQACHYVRQAALGLQHAFEKGMVHRDIKPQNLMLTPQGQVKVLDFGLAKVVSENRPKQTLTALNAYMGTPEYSAPEQAADARSADIRADVYSLGCTLYCLLAGRPPFQEDTPVKTILAHLEKEPPPLPEVRPDVPPALWQVLARLLAKDPSQRYQKPIEAAQALLAFAKLGQKGVAPPSPARPSGAVPAARGTRVSSDGSRTPSSLKGPTSRPPASQEPGPVPLASPFEGLGETPAAAPKTAKGERKNAEAAPAVWRKRSALLGGFGAAALLLVLMGLWAAGVLRVKTKDGTIVLEDLPPDAEVLVDGAKVTVTWAGGTRAEVSIKPGTHEVVATKGGTKVVGEQVVIEEGGQKVISARSEPPARAEAGPVRGKDPLQEGSVWRGVGAYTVRGLPGQPPGKFNCTLHITQRTGDRFKGTYEFEDGSEVASTFEGTLGEPVGATGKRKIRWQHVQDIKGDAIERAPTVEEGTIEGPVLDVGFSHRDRNTGLPIGSGVIGYRIEVPAYPHGGNWRVEGDEVIQDAAGSALSFLLFGDPSWTDYDMTVETQRIQGNDLGWVVFRCEDVLNYWALGVWIWDRGQTLVVLTRVDGIPKPVQEKGWTADDAWHKLAVKVRGERIRCYMDDDPIVDIADGRHPRGYVALATTKTATRFRNLRVTDGSGGVLVDGVRSLNIMGRDGGASGDATVPAGSVWSGTFRQLDRDNEHDLLIRIQKREGTKFEGTYWIDRETNGLKIEGDIDALGNISWRPTEVLAGDVWFPDVCDTLMTGTVKGRRMRAYALYPQHQHFTAEMTLTRSN